jgi:hypothetical protein
VPAGRGGALSYIGTILELLLEQAQIEILEIPGDACDQGGLIRKLLCPRFDGCNINFRRIYRVLRAVIIGGLKRKRSGYAAVEDRRIGILATLFCLVSTLMAEQRRSFYCPPEKVGLVDAQYAAIMSAYLQRFPRVRSQPPAAVLLFALQDAFPCEAR